MRKWMIAAILGIVLISGCVSSPSGQVISENKNTDLGIVQHSGSCRTDTDCIMVYCRNTPEDLHCMSTTQFLTDIKCGDNGNLISMKNYDVCGCVEGTCVIG